MSIDTISTRSWNFVFQLLFWKLFLSHFVRTHSTENSTPACKFWICVKYAPFFFTPKPKKIEWPHENCRFSMFRFQTHVKMRNVKKSWKTMKLGNVDFFFKQLVCNETRVKLDDLVTISCKPNSFEMTSSQQMNSFEKKLLKFFMLTKSFLVK